MAIPRTPGGRDQALDRVLTLALLAGCLAVAAAAGLPRLAPRVEAPAAVQPDLTVHVHGEIVRPGTYALPWGARVADLVEVAGGLTADADPGLVTAAAVLTDGRTVVVPGRRAPEGEIGRVDVNTASERLLTTLPGIGPVTARRMIDGRPYHALEDLLRVPGIGPARLEALRPRVTL
ncbi:MAG: ComEA family DNA-binding protein [Trueperaceae bacterium]|nr:MAG: ComEA family DNA-binding protein [Trueperaceae bacterium]